MAEVKRVFRGIVDVPFYGDSAIQIGSHGCGTNCFGGPENEHGIKLPTDTQCVLCLLEALSGRAVRVTVETL